MSIITSYDGMYFLTTCHKIYNISEHFKVQEMIRTNQGNKYLHLQIDNCSIRNILNMVRLSVVLEGLRKYLCDTQLIINSGYRCKELNNKVNGSPTSYHLLGAAADIRITPTPLLRNYFDTLKTFKIVSEVIYHNNYIHVAIYPH